MRILLIEDDPAAAAYVARGLSEQGHVCNVLADGTDGLFEATRESYDVLVVDRMLPGLDGLSLVRALRAAGRKTPVLFLTALGGIDDRVEGLEAGGDDYLTKPFVMDELLARIEVLGRRGIALEATNILRVADLIMDVAARRITRSGERIEISPREFDVLQILMREPGRTFSRDEICGRIWEREHQYDTRTVEIFIMRLRRKLDFGGKPALIHTVRGSGYRLQVPE